MRAAEGFKFVTEIDVFWGDMDAFGHVNNVQYFRYFEQARINYQRAIEASMTSKVQGHPILAKTSCEYYYPVFYPDKLWVSVRVSRIGRSSLTQEMKIFSESSKKIVAEGEAIVVWYDPEKKASMRLSEEMLKALRDFEENPNLGV